jgi:hypothetical protein
MTETLTATSRAIPRENNHAAARGAADFLHLAAGPTFAVMALLTCVLGGGPADALCSIAGASPLSGMVPMYLLMSAFHLAPWLKLMAHRRSGAPPPGS